MDAVTRDLMRQVDDLQRQVDGLVKPEITPNILDRYLTLPGLRGFWPCGAIGPGVLSAANVLADQSGLNNRLSNNGSTPVDFENLISYIELNGSTQYFNLPDATANNAFDILGNEAVIGTPGLTFGFWANIDAVTPATQNTIAAKFETTANQRAYMLFMAGGGGTDVYSFNISSTGADGFTVNSSVSITAATNWYHVVVRFTPSTEIAIFVNSTKSTNTTSIPATIFNSSADFTVGSINAGARLFDGKLSTGFVCAAALSDSIINALFQQSRVLYGV